MDGEKTSYVTQLKEVFDSCDTFHHGFLTESELHVLCEKLHLSEQEYQLVDNLLKDNSVINFEDFKECFVAVLSQGNQDIPTNENLKDNEDEAECEVSPKFTFGRKKYGRRSRPCSIIEGAMHDDTLLSSSHVSSPGDNFLGKRPVSPNDFQPPPTKSGRLHEEQEINYSSSLPSSDSELSFETNPVEYLQETWKKLGIGQNGYLNVEELACVCDYIGMDMTEEVVVQLFHKLDCDQDGQISFEEFLQGLFQHGDPLHSESMAVKSSSNFNQTSIKDNQILNEWPAGVFSAIDQNNSGSADASSIMELWESLELPCSPRLLEDLGFNIHSKIKLNDLTSVFEEMLNNALKRPVLQLAFSTFQNEINYLRQTINQMQDERRKLRENVEEANTRAALLAQEVDDNHAKLENSLQRKLLVIEKKYQDQMKHISDELQQEKDMNISHSGRMKQLQQAMASALEEETKMKTKLNLMQQENGRLEHELHEMSEKLISCEKYNEILEKELLAVPDLKKKLSEFETQLLQEQQGQTLILELEKCKKNNQELLDKIDELTLKMEQIEQNVVSEPNSSKTVTRNHSWLSDYNKTEEELKRQGSESSDIEDNSEEEHICVSEIKSSVIRDHLFDCNSMQMAEDIENISLDSSSRFSVDVLLKDLFVDKTVLMQRLQVTEEKYLKSERAYKNAELKIQLLNQILRNMATAVIS